MARLIRLVEIGGAASYLSSAADFLAVVVCVLGAATLAVVLCAKEFKDQQKSRRSEGCTEAPPGCLGNLKVPAESKGRAFIKTLSSNSLLLSKKWRRGKKEEAKEYDDASTEDGDFLWQKRIMMGVRCKPLNFSGLIVYDNKGERLPQFPLRSPKNNAGFLPSPKVDEEAYYVSTSQNKRLDSKDLHDQPMKNWFENTKPISGEIRCHGKRENISN